MKRESIITKEPFEGLFPIDNHTLQAVIEDMKVNGYDPGCPVTVWKGKRICIDGHTRLMAAESCGIKDVPAFGKHFESEDGALQYAIHCQRDRRNMTDADIVRCVEVVDKRKQLGGQESNVNAAKTNGSTEAAVSEPTSETTAKTVGTSASKVKKVRAIIDHADEKTKEAVKGGEKSIHKAYTETQKKRKPKATKPIPQPTEAMQFASMAIVNLENIRNEDPMREPALIRVGNWCEDQIRDHPGSLGG